MAAGFLIVMYLPTSSPSSRRTWRLARLSIFHYFDLKPLIDAGTYPTGDSLLFLVVAAAGWLLALVLFRRRDLAA